MARLVFTQHLREVAYEGDRAYEGGVIRDVLARACDDFPLLENYLLDDQLRVRRHVCIFLDGARLLNRQALDRTVSETSEVYVMQALSGG